MKSIGREQLLKLFEENNSQASVAEVLGISQMTVSRHAKRLGVFWDGKVAANRDIEKRANHSKVLREGFRSGRITPSWTGKKQSPETIEKRVRQIRGKPAWNSGKAIKAYSICQICFSKFEHSPRRLRKFCGRTCSGKNVSDLHAKGKYEKNKQGRGNGGRYGGRWMRSSWEIEFAKRLDSVGILWEYEREAFKLSSGKSYRPDFYIPKLSLLIEIKGHWWPDAKAKFNLFRREFPEREIIVIREELWHERLGSR